MTSVTAALMCGAWLTAVRPSPALGHSMTVTRGTAVVEGESLTMSFSVGAEALLHVHDLSDDSDGLFTVERVRRAAAAYGDALRQQIVIRNSLGDVIDGRLRSWTLEGPAKRRMDNDDLRQALVQYALAYDLERADKYLSFQQAGQDAKVVLPSRIVLDVRHADVSLRAIQLTRGGNVEIVRLAPIGRGIGLAGNPTDVQGDAGCLAGRFVLSEAQKTIRALVRVHDAGVRVDLFVPFRLLESWYPLDRTQRDFIDVDEQQRCQSEIARFIAAHNPLSIDERRLDGKITGVEFLDVGESGGNVEHSRWRLSTLTSRVRITTEYSTPDRPQSLDLHWTLFNASILAAYAMVIVDDNCLAHDISTYDPHLEWTRDTATPRPDRREDK